MHTWQGTNLANVILKKMCVLRRPSKFLVPLAPRSLLLRLAPCSLLLLLLSANGRQPGTAQLTDVTRAFD